MLSSANYSIALTLFITAWSTAGGENCYLTTAGSSALADGGTKNHHCLSVPGEKTLPSSIVQGIQKIYRLQIIREINMIYQGLTMRSIYSAVCLSRLIRRKKKPGYFKARQIIGEKCHKSIHVEVTEFRLESTLDRRHGVCLLSIFSCCHMARSTLGVISDEGLIPICSLRAINSW